MNENLSPRQRAFLAAYSEVASVVEASKASEVARETHYGWLRNDPAYQVAFEEARMRAGDLLEAAAYKRARDGWEELVLFEGKPVEIPHRNPISGAIEKKPLTRRRFSDHLTMKLLAHLNPARWGEKKTLELQETQKVEVEMSVSVSRLLTSATDEELDVLERLAKRAAAVGGRGDVALLTDGRAEAQALPED